MTLLQALRNSTQRIESDLNNSSLFRQSGDKGKFREAIVQNFLRPFLPPCYGLGSGEVFSSTGAQSNQIDVVVYDAVFSNVLFRDDPISLYPCEAVFGTIEVKSRLDSDELELAVKNIASIKRLPRAPSDMCDILPFRRFGIGEGLSYDERPRNNYLGLVFAYDGLRAETVVENLNKRVASSEQEQQYLPDFVFNFRRGYSVMRMRLIEGQFSPVPPGQPFDVFANIESGADTLPLFFLTANTCLNNIILKAPNVNEYWRQVFTEIVRSG